MLTEEQIISSFIQCGIGSTTTGNFHNYLKELLENGNFLLKASFYFFNYFLFLNEAEAQNLNVTEDESDGELNDFFLR